MIPIAKPLIGEEEKKAVLEVLESGMLASGPKVKELEDQFSKFCGTKYAIAVNNGTSALHTALYSAGIKNGDEVITVPFTFVASANCILMQGGKIVFVDVDEDTFNINVAQVEKKITSKTKAIVVVDLYGQPADYDKLHEIARKHNIKIIEDAAQAHGAEYKGTKAGNLGDVGCFSLYATKNMMSGEGGIITTNDSEMAELCKRFRHHGQSEQTKYEYHDLGYNYRMTDLQAAIALAQFGKLDDLTRKRIKNAEMLTNGLKNIKGIIVPKVLPNVKHVFHQYTLKITDEFSLTRDELARSLKEKGIGCATFYPKPLHLHPHFARLGYEPGDFSTSEKLSKSVLSLPIHPSVNEEDIEKIISTIKGLS